MRKSVPFRNAPASYFSTLPPSISTTAPSTPSEVHNDTFDTAAILAKASPRNPSVRIRNRSCSLVILLVACLSKQRMASSSDIPLPLSVTRIEVKPASTRDTSILVLCASIAFSTSSLTIEAGRSTTSPAAILLASVSSIM